MDTPVFLTLSVEESDEVSISQLRGVVFGIATLVNSYMPVSGHTRYLAGRPCLGLGRVTMRASGVAFEGSMKIFEGFSTRDDRLNLDEVDLGSEAFVSAAAALVDLVLAIARLYGK
jgi:hypothetical protein